MSSILRENESLLRIQLALFIFDNCHFCNVTNQGRLSDTFAGVDTVLKIHMHSRTFAQKKELIAKDLEDLMARSEPMRQFICL